MTGDARTGTRHRCPKLAVVSRTVLYEWIAVAVLLLGLAVATAGVISIPLNSSLARVLIPAGAVVAVVGGIIWTLVVKAGARARARASH